MTQKQERKKKEKLDLSYNLKTYFGFLMKYKWMFILVTLLALFNEIFNLAERYFMKVIIDNGTNYAAGSLALNIFTKILIAIAIGYGTVFVAKAIFKWFSLHLVNILEVSVIYDLKKKFFNHLVTLSHSFHTTHRTGSLISRIIRGGNATERMTDFMVFNTFPIVFQILATSIPLIYLSLTSAIIMILVCAVFISFGLIMQRITNKANDEFNKKEDFEKATIGDIFTNIDSVKYFGKEEFTKDRFAKVGSTTQIFQLRFWQIFRWASAGEAIILSAGTFLLMFFSLRDFMAGRISIGTLTFVYSTYLSLLGNLYNFMSGVRGYYRSMTDFQDLFQYGKIEQEVKDKPNAEELSISHGKIDFKDVSFKYHQRSIFNKFNLEIKPGEKVALVGHSGSGKTTLVKLLYRLYDVESGSIQIDGKDIRELKQESLRGELSIVPQECVLFDDTIFNNIKFSRPNATKAEVLQAMKFAQLDKIVATFPYQENTIVGERGVKLSGGEKQRVSIARAILANKRIIVLDEATSSLDSQTEHEIQGDLARLLEGRTSIIIAHRLSTIMNADKIVVLDKGKIVQIGSHRELIRKPGQYRKLWNLQKGGYIQD